MVHEVVADERVDTFGDGLEDAVEDQRERGVALVFSPEPNTPTDFSKSVAMMPSPFLNCAKLTLPHSQFLCRPNTFSASR